MAWIELCSPHYVVILHTCSAVFATHTYCQYVILLPIFANTKLQFVFTELGLQMYKYTSRTLPFHPRLILGSSAHLSCPHKSRVPLLSLLNIREDLLPLKIIHPIFLSV